MKCANCPLFSWWNNESDKGESCGLFGDSWDSAFQYEDKEGNIVGCYIDRHYIEQTDERYMRHLEECVERFKAEEAKGEYDWLKEKKEKKHELGMDTHILCE